MDLGKVCFTLTHMGRGYPPRECAPTGSHVVGGDCPGHRVQLTASDSRCLRIAVTPGLPHTIDDYNTHRQSLDECNRDGIIHFAGAPAPHLPASNVSVL